MSNWNTNARLGGFFVFGIALLWVIYSSLSSQSSLSGGYILRIEFKDLKQLRASDDVRLSGVRIGHVVETGLSEGKPFAKIFIKDEYGIPKDSVIYISTKGFFGNNYLAVQAGSSKTIVDKDDGLKALHIPDFNDLIAENSSRINSIIKNADTISTEFSNLVQEIGANKNEGVSNLLLGESIKVSILKTLESFRTSVAETSKIAIQFREFAEELKSNEGSVAHRIIYEKDLGDDLTATLKNIRGFTQKLNSENSTLGRIISNDELYKIAKSTLAKAERAVDAIGQGGPISALGILVNSLF